jgi:hypothetical protein
MRGSRSERVISNTTLSIDGATVAERGAPKSNDISSKNISRFSRPTTVLMPLSPVIDASRVPAFTTNTNRLGTRSDGLAMQRWRFIFLPIASSSSVVRGPSDVMPCRQSISSHSSSWLAVVRRGLNISIFTCGTSIAGHYVALHIEHPPFGFSVGIITDQGVVLARNTHGGRNLCHGRKQNLLRLPVGYIIWQHDFKIVPPIPIRLAIVAKPKSDDCYNNARGGQATRNRHVADNR